MQITLYHEVYIIEFIEAHLASSLNVPIHAHSLCTGIGTVHKVKGIQIIYHLIDIHSTLKTIHGNRLERSNSRNS